MNSRRPWKILQIRLRPSRQFSMLRFYFAFQYRHPSERNTFHKQHLALNKTLTLECHPKNILKLSVYSIRYANAHCPATICKLTFNYGTEHNESQLQNSPYALTLLYRCEGFVCAIRRHPIWKKKIWMNLSGNVGVFIVRDIVLFVC